MPVQTLHDTGNSYLIPSKFDGAVYASAVSDCVCEGVGEQFDLHYAADSLDVYFNAGSEAVIGGSFFKVTATDTIHLNANATIYLCAEIDLSKPNGQRGLFAQKTANNMSSQNLNGSGTTRDLLLYVITTSGSGVTAVQDKRIIRGAGTSISGIGLDLTGSSGSQQLTATKGSLSLKFKVISEADYNSLATKDANTLYFIPES